MEIQRLTNGDMRRFPHLPPQASRDIKERLKIKLNNLWQALLEFVYHNKTGLILLFLFTYCRLLIILSFI